MKRISEVFKGEPCGFSVRMSDEQVLCGQHAINHIDALADALADLLECAAENNLDGLQAYDDAYAALVAYRGEE